MNEKRLIRFIIIAPLVFIPAIAIILSYFSITHNQEIIENTSKNLKERLMREHQNNIVSKVKMAVELIKYERSTIEMRLKEKVKLRVDKAYDIASNIYLQNKDEHPIHAIQSMIVDAIRPLVWNNGESFIFILDKEGTFILAPKYLTHLEGKNISNFQDVTGRYVIREEIQMVKNHREGFLWDTFTRPGKDLNKQYKQLAFVKNFEHFNWYMGSAEYLDTTTKEIESSIIAILRNINKDKSNYFFILNTKGEVILHTYNPELEGTNLLLSKKQNQIDTIQTFINNANTKKDSFISYSWENPITHILEKKCSYVEKIPNTDWLIGSGFYVNDLDKIVATKQSQLETLNHDQLQLTITFSLLFILLSTLISWYISRKLQHHFNSLKMHLALKSDELSKLNISLEEKISERTQELNDAYKKMEQIATIDTLTGINNRYSFLNAFESEMKKYLSTHTNFTLLMIDIDHFKQINDNHGHDVGDRTLITMTQIVQECLRSNDLFGRMGGEEFMILLPHTPLTSAEEIAKRIQKSINEYKFDIIQHVTVSIGVVEYREGESDIEMFKRADIALYEAKHSGRNKVVVSY